MYGTRSDLNNEEPCDFTLSGVQWDNRNAINVLWLVRVLFCDDVRIIPTIGEHARCDDGTVSLTRISYLSLKDVIFADYNVELANLLVVCIHHSAKSCVQARPRASTPDDDGHYQGPTDDMANRAAHG